MKIRRWALDKRLARCWSGNPNARHLGHSKRRFAVESETAAHMVLLPKLAVRMGRIGRWRRGPVQATYDALLLNHPSVWAFDAPGSITRLYVPTKALATARAWNYLVRSLVARLHRIEMRILGWSNFKFSNDRRDVAREIPYRDNSVPTAMKTLLAGYRGPVGSRPRP